MSLGHVRNAVVVSCDEWACRTGRLAEHTRQATVLVITAGVAAGCGEHVCDGAAVSAPGDVHVRGNVDSPLPRLSITYPGGVVPVVDVCLMHNTATAADWHTCREAWPLESIVDTALVKSTRQADFGRVGVIHHTTTIAAIGWNLNISERRSDEQVSACAFD